MLDSLVHCKPIHAVEPNRIIRRKTIQCFCDRTDKVIQIPLLVLLSVQIWNQVQAGESFIHLNEISYIASLAGLWRPVRHSAMRKYICTTLTALW